MEGEIPDIENAVAIDVIEERRAFQDAVGRIEPLVAVSIDIHRRAAIAGEADACLSGRRE